MSGGTNSSDSSSRPLKAHERRTAFEYGNESINSAQPDYSGLSYNAPETQRLSSGDYDALEQSMLTSQWAPIEALQEQRFSDIDQEMSDRGLYTSGVGADTKQDIFTSDFLPAYQQAAANATTQRYGLESQENAMENQMALQNAQQDFASQWAPYEYLMGLWNNTGGQISSSSTSGWNFGL